MKPGAVALLVVVLLCFGIAAVTILIALDKSPVQLLGMLTAVAAPTITSLISLVKIDNLQTQVSALQGDVEPTGKEV